MESIHLQTGGANINHEIIYNIERWGLFVPKRVKRLARNSTNKKFEKNENKKVFLNAK